MHIISKIKMALFILIVTSLCLVGCTAKSVFLHELESANKFCKTEQEYLHKLPILPHRVTVDEKTGVETWAWDCDVLRKKRMDKTQGDKYWYGGYYADCTYEVDFDKQGNKIDARWIGAGCFNSRGELYNEGSFFYDE